MDNIVTLPTFPPPAYHPAVNGNAAARSTGQPAVRHDTRPIDRLEVFDNTVRQGRQHTQRRRNGLHAVVMDTCWSAAATAMCFVGADVAARGSAIGLIPLAAGAAEEALALQGIGLNPATSRHAARGHTVMSVGATIFGIAAGTILGINSGSADVLTYASVGINVATALVWEAAGAYVAGRSVAQNTAPHQGTAVLA